MRHALVATELGWMCTVCGTQWAETAEEFAGEECPGTTLPTRVKSYLDDVKSYMDSDANGRALIEDWEKGRK